MFATPTSIVTMCRISGFVLTALVSLCAFFERGTVLLTANLTLGMASLLVTPLIMLALPTVSRQRICNGLLTVVALIFLTRGIGLGLHAAVPGVLWMVAGIWLGQLPPQIQRVRRHARRYGQIEFAVIAIEEARRRRDRRGRAHHA